MDKIFLIILAIFLPPFAVLIYKDVGSHLALNILLCFLFVIPASIHAVYLVTR
jgi:uncharacterized membrane protein YqaE (UPF0057 family)